MHEFKRGFDRRSTIKALSGGLVAGLASVLPAAAAGSSGFGGRRVPRFTPDPEPFLKIPAGRFLGPVTGLAIAPNGHIWLCHLSKQLEWGAPEARWRDEARLPPVIEFDQRGNFIRAWGGPDHLPRINGRPQWLQNEETISIDDEGAIWMFGSNKAYDHAVQRFSSDGKLLLRIGVFGEAGNDTSRDRLGCPTDAFHDVKRREVFVSDGYVNHRVVVFNSDTGEFVRAFGAYGATPPPWDGEASSFSNPVHAISRGPDGHLYVSDRMNNRIQVFDAVGRPEARFLREIAIPGRSQHGTAFNVAFGPRGEFMFVADGDNNRIWTVDLKAWEIVDTFKVSASDAPDAVLHKIVTDAAGNLLVARTSVGVLRFNYSGLA